MSQQDTLAHQDFYAWVDDNPLRKWRREHGVSVMRAASALGASMTAIQLWERGVHKPTGTNADTVRDAIGEKGWKRWDAWLSDRPARPLSA